MSNYKTQAAFAKALDVHRGTMSKWTDRPDWPVRKSPPWSTADLAAVQKWRADNLREDRAALDHGDDHGETLELRKAKLTQEIRKLTAQASAAELSLEREAGKLLSREEVDRGQVERVALVRNAMRLAGRKLSVKLQGVTAFPEIERIVDEEMQYVCNSFANGETPYADEQDGDAAS